MKWRRIYWIYRFVPLICRKTRLSFSSAYLISYLQEKLEKSYKELRTVLEENKTLKQRLEGGEKTRGKIRNISEHNGSMKMVNGNEGASGVDTKVRNAPFAKIV